MHARFGWWGMIALLTDAAKLVGKIRQTICRNAGNGEVFKTDVGTNLVPDS